MTYYKPYVDSKGLHIPTYNDILEKLVASMKQIYGDDIYLETGPPDFENSPYLPYGSNRTELSSAGFLLLL